MNNQPPSARGSVDESCGTCGGDRRIGNSFGLTTTCPSCHGSGRRPEHTGFHDVTKTKESHHRPTNRAPVVEKKLWPTSFEGGQLATEVRDSATCREADKPRLIREIIDHETSHGTCTQTFVKKMRKLVRPPAMT